MTRERTHLGLVSLKSRLEKDFSVSSLIWEMILGSINKKCKVSQRIIEKLIGYIIKERIIVGC